MITSAASVAAGAHLTADLVIVGGGAAGITIAKRLAGSKHRVILLESGGLEPDDFSQSLYQGTIGAQATEPTDVSRLRYFGGTTNHWAGWCRPLEPSDFEKRADWPDSGWPISRATLDPYYKQASELCQLGTVSFDDLSFWQRQKGGAALTAFPLDAGLLRTSIVQCSPPTRFGETYRKPIADARNIQVLLNANVLELLPAPASHADRQRKAIGGVSVKGPKGNFTVSGRATVAALGGIENARLLLLSDKVHPKGAGNENDLVGRYFMDHPLLSDAAYLRFAHDGFPAPLYFGDPVLGGGHIFGTVTGAPQMLRREKIGAFRMILRPSRISTAGADSMRELAHGHFAHLGENLGNIFGDFDVLADAAYKTITHSRLGFLGDGNGPTKGAFVDLNFEQHPNRDSRVVLENKRDALGQRRVRLEWRLGETDRRTAMRALDIAAHEFARAGLGRTRSKLDVGGNKPWPWEMRGSNHHSGTARMSASPADGVVDADCRVHSTENLYVAGSAVFCTTGYANPTLTIVALANRLADHLGQVLA